MQVLLIGDVGRLEMQPMVAWLRARTDAESLRWVPTISNIQAGEGTKHQSALAFDQPPDLIVVLQSHPDEFFAADVAALCAAEPLARIVCCAGGWSESSGRTRSLWPLALRVPATAALARLEQEWNLLTHADLALCLPPTGSREEWFAAHHGGQGLEKIASRRVRLKSPDPHYRQMLADWLTLWGMTPCEDDSAEVVCWDVDPWNGEWKDELRRQSAATSIIALAGWITPDREADLKSAGVRAVVSKLGNIHHLLAAICDAATIPVQLC